MKLLFREECVLTSKLCAYDYTWVPQNVWTSYIHSFICSSRFIRVSRESRVYPRSQAGIRPEWKASPFQGIMHTHSHTHSQCRIANPHTACLWEVEGTGEPRGTLHGHEETCTNFANTLTRAQDRTGGDVRRINTTPFNQLLLDLTKSIIS